MNEQWRDQLARVRMMASDDGDTWDLSENDKAALSALLNRFDAVAAAFDEWHTTPDIAPSNELIEALAGLVE